ncbi:outer membrane beta-barrel protein [Hymenobacter edaphi]|nr:outer membrane beta-barrel protein [Hymenobacter edaphi]
MQKPLLALAACGLLLPAAQAQTERGAKLLGVSVGNLSYSRTKYSGSAFSAALHPTAAYFLADNLALGAGLNLSYGRQRSNGAQYYREFGYGLAPFVRYYLPGSSRHRVFGEVGADVGRTHYRGLDYRPVIGPGTWDYYTRSAGTFGYHGTLGYNFFLTPNAALEASAGYYRVAHDPIFNPRHVVDVRLGFSVLLPASGSN